MASFDSAATFYALSQLKEQGIDMSEENFDAICREMPFLTREGYEEFKQKLSLFDKVYYAPLSDETPFEDSQTNALSKYLRSETQEPADTENSTDSNEEALNSKKPPKDSFSSALLRIHVIDEAKRRSQDFFCRKALLVSKMKFFSAHLTDDSKPDDVDISVQCDVVIFDWLMKYVHKDTEESTEVPTLDDSNVVSILIASDFLRMDDLVSESFAYFRANAEDVINNSPANFNCITDVVLKRLATMFSVEDLDSIADKKDRIKSRLYQAKIEAMFTRNAGRHLININPAHKDHLSQLIMDDIDIPDASSLFQCSFCQKLLTPASASLLPCTVDQLQLSRDGDIVSNHVPQDGFDINEYLSAQHKESGSWRTVFWKLWASIQMLRCARCRKWFRCIDYPSCWNHPEKPTIDIYPCCKAPYRPFDPFIVRAGGCKNFDHLTDFQVGGDKTKRIYELLMRFREPIVGNSTVDANPQTSLTFDPVIFIKSLMPSDKVDKTPEEAKPGVQFDFPRFIKTTWNEETSTRLNQDNQRQADYIIMRELSEHIIQRKAAALTASANKKPTSHAVMVASLPVVPSSTISSSMSKEVPGGLYARIEHHLRSKMHALLAPGNRIKGIHSRQRPSSLLK